MATLLSLRHKGAELDSREQTSELPYMPMFHNLLRFDLARLRQGPRFLKNRFHF